MMMDTASATAADPDPDKVLDFRDGFPGFPASRRFVLSDLSEDGPFRRLPSLDEEAVPMVVGAPWHNAIPSRSPLALGGG